MNGLYDELKLALHAVWTRRWIALAAAWAICLLGWLVVSQIPNSYESRARVFVQPSTLPTSVGISGADQQKDIDTIRQTLTSAVNLAKVVKGTDLANTVASDKDVAARAAGLQQAITVTQQQDNLFGIKATAGSPRLAHQIVAKLIDIFVQQNLADDKSDTTQTLQFLDGQLAQRQKQLQDADTQRSAFKSQYLAGLPGTGSLDDRIAAANSQLAQVNSDLAAAKSSLSTLNAQLAGTPAITPGTASAPAGSGAARVAAIKGQLAEMRSRGWTDAYPDVAALKSQLAAAEQVAKNEPRAAASGGTPNPLYMSLQSMQADKQSTVAALTQQKAQLQSDLSALQSKLAQNPEVAAQQGDIERNYQFLKDQYDKMLADREQAKLQAQAQDQTDTVKFSVIDPPTLPTKPAAPNRPLLLTGVLIVGLGGGIAIAFALSQLRMTFANATRLEKISGMQVIGSIGEVVTAAQTDARRKRLTYFAGAAGALGIAYVALLGVEFLQRGLAA